MNLIKIIMNSLKIIRVLKAFVFADGDFILGVNFRQQRGKRTFPSTLHYMPGLQNLAGVTLTRQPFKKKNLESKSR